MNDLIEVMPFEYQIVESDSGCFRVEGVFQRSDVENANKRVYPRSIWERELGEPRISEAVAERAMFGELDHPSDGKTKLTRVAHVITDLKLQEDGIVTGAAEVLPTPNGEILKALFESGVQVGISSRGSGSVQNGRVQEDFKLNTFDFVARPSTPGALPRPSGESKGSTTEDVVDATVKVIEDDTDTTSLDDADMVEKILAELNGCDLNEDASDRDFNAVARDTIVMHNAIHDEDLELTPEVIEAIGHDTLELGHELTRLAAEYPEYKAVVADLLEKVTESREAVINGVVSNNRKEEPMDRLEFIKERLQESGAQAMDEEQELRSALEEMTDDELVELALEAGIVELEEDDDDADDEVTPEQLFDYIEELEAENSEAAQLIETMADALEEAEGDDVADLKLKYEASLGIIQETVSRFQLLSEAVGGEDKADELMEAHLQALENDETDDNVNEDAKDAKAQNLNEDSDEANDIERLLGDNVVEDEKMARYVELSESACDRAGLN